MVKASILISGFLGTNTSLVNPLLFLELLLGVVFSPSVGRPTQALYAAHMVPGVGAWGKEAWLGVCICFKDCAFEGSSGTHLRPGGDQEEVIQGCP